MIRLNLNKKTISLLLAGAISFSTIQSKKTLAEGDNTYLMTTTKVNLRSDSNTDSNIIVTLNSNEILESSKLLSNGWYEVNYNGEIAYICGDYVSIINKPNEENKEIVRATDSVRVRSTPSLDGDVLGVIEKGDALDYVNTFDDDWYEVMYKGNYAYVSSKYSKLTTEGLIIENVPTVTATTDVRIRDDNTTSGEKLGVLKKGKSLEYTRRLDNGWYEVNYNGQVGYVCGDYVREENQNLINNEVYKVVSMNKDATIYKDRYFREPLASIPKYEIGNIYSRGENYYFIESGDLTGYIRREDAQSLGNIAVVVDVSSQLLTLYKDAKPYYTSDVVTGTNEMPTDFGLYEINKKMKDYYLSAYDVYVTFWMPFNRDQGLHDAVWRKKFGGNIYKNNGSHGCINLPYETAEKLYDTVEVGTKVLVKK